MGDASIGVSMRNFISTPNIRLKRMLRQHFCVLHLDEFRTSCINFHTDEYSIGNLSYNDKVGKQRRLHSVLVYKTQNRVETVRGRVYAWSDQSGQQRS